MEQGIYSGRDTLRREILRLKEEKKAVILAHNYQLPEIQDIADSIGDSLELSKQSVSLGVKTIVFCGVKFMAETAKILSPEKKVLLPVFEAGCALAETIEPDQLLELKAKHPDAWVISYVNTSAEIKALSDVCCTSANAVNVVRNVPVKKVIFVPDRNLGWWVQKNVPEKEIILWPGYCYVHEQFTPKMITIVRKNYQSVIIMAHPECRKEILQQVDHVASTSGMLKIAKQTKAKTIIVATEIGMIYRLEKDNPDKKFYSLGSAKTCASMKQITLKDLHRSLEKEIHPVDVDKDIASRARLALEKMVKYV